MGWAKLAINVLIFLRKCNDLRAMIVARWLAGGALIALAAWIIALNWVVFWRIHIQKRKAPSWIPLVGGVLGVAGLLVLPSGNKSYYAWMLLLVDYGSIPGIAYSLTWNLLRRRT